MSKTIEKLLSDEIKGKTVKIFDSGTNYIKITFEDGSVLKLEAQNTGIHGLLAIDKEFFAKS